MIFDENSIIQSWEDLFVVIIGLIICAVLAIIIGPVGCIVLILLFLMAVGGLLLFLEHGYIKTKEQSQKTNTDKIIEVIGDAIKFIMPIIIVIIIGIIVIIMLMIGVAVLLSAPAWLLLLLLILSLAEGDNNAK